MSLQIYRNFTLGTLSVWAVYFPKNNNWNSYSIWFNFSLINFSFSSVRSNKNDYSCDLCPMTSTSPCSFMPCAWDCNEWLCDGTALLRQADCPPCHLQLVQQWFNVYVRRWNCAWLYGGTRSNLLYPFYTLGAGSYRLTETVYICQHIVNIWMSLNVSNNENHAIHEWWWILIPCMVCMYVFVSVELNLTLVIAAGVGAALLLLFCSLAVCLCYQRCYCCCCSESFCGQTHILLNVISCVAVCLFTLI